MNSTAVELPSHMSKRRTLIKDRVGCVRSPATVLPPADHVYGLKVPPDAEGARELLSTWIEASPTTFQNMGKKSVYANVMALKAGYITAKDMRQFALEHPNIHIKEVANDDKSAHKSRAKLDGPFGIKTVTAEEKFESIIQGKYVSYANDAGDYPDVTCIKKKGSMPKPKSTVASDLLQRTRNETKVEKPRFIMNRFKQVQPTMHMHLTKTERDYANNKIENTAADEVDEEPQV